MKSLHTTVPLLLILAAGSALAATPAQTSQTHASPHRTAEARSADAKAQTAPVGQVWDWSKIDTNKDNLIEPEELEAWLKANPPVQKGG